MFGEEIKIHCKSAHVSMHCKMWGSDTYVWKNKIILKKQQMKKKYSEINKINWLIWWFEEEKKAQHVLME